MPGPSDEGRLKAETELGKCPDRDGLYRSPPDPPTDRILDSDHAIAVLMDASRHLPSVTGVVMIAVDVKIAPPLAMASAVQSEVEPGPEMEACP